MRRTALFAGWCALLVSALWFLHVIGRDDLATPPAPTRWQSWIDDIGPGAAIVAVMRVAGIVVGWYLVLVTVVGALGRRYSARLVVNAADRITPRLLRSVLGSARGLVVGAAGLTVAVTPLLVPNGEGVVSVVRTGAGPTAALARVANPPSAVLRRVPAGVLAPGQPAADVVERTATLERIEFGLAPLSPVAGVDVWVVQSGDHFWSIAEETLFDAWGRMPTDEEITPYWRALIGHNRSRLVSPDAPDFIHPGQQFELPTPPSSSSCEPARGIESPPACP